MWNCQFCDPWQQTIRALRCRVCDRTDVRVGQVRGK